MAWNKNMHYELEEDKAQVKVREIPRMKSKE